MTRWIYHFGEDLPVGADERELLGGKGSSLRQMTRAGLRVPPGFTITTAGCAEYYRLGRRWPAGLAEEVSTQLAGLEGRCRQRFGHGAQPLLVSVRSGAAQSMPGMMDTLLNCGLHPGLAAELDTPAACWPLYRRFVAAFARTVHGISPDAFDSVDDAPGATALLARYRALTGTDFPATPIDLLHACINAVFDSWNSERAVAYRERHGIRHLGGTAVTVQQMFPSEISGVVFTQDPTAPTEERLVVEAAWGLGEAVVSGDVSPDRWLVDRRDLGKVTAFGGRKVALVRALGDTAPRDPTAPCLDPRKLRELCELSLRVEAHSGHPVDLEFGVASGELALLQARAIRGLDMALAVEPERQREIGRLRDLAAAAGRRKVWIAHNLGETLPAPTPLTWDLIRDFMRGDGGFGRLYRELGHRPSREVGKDGFLELIGGRIYADPDRLAGLFWDGIPFTYPHRVLPPEELGPGLIEGPPQRFDPQQADGRFLLAALPTTWAILRAAWRLRRIRRTVRRDYEETILPAWLRWIADERRRDLTAIDHPALLALFAEREQRTLQGFGPCSLLPGFLGGMAYDRLTRRLTRLLGDDEGRSLAATLTQALDDDVTFEQNALLAAVARGERDLAAVIERFGHRCPGEMELSQPRYREDDSYLRATIARLARPGAADPLALHRENRARRDAAEAALPDTLARHGGSCWREEILRDLAQARALLPYRETGKFHLMMGYDLLRQVLEELDRRLALDGGIYFLHRNELAAAVQLPGEFAGRIADRRRIWQAQQRLSVAVVIDSDDLDGFGLAPALAAATVFTGTAVAAGRARGPVRIVEDPATAGELGTGYVLVCRSTDPGWTPLFLNACALVVERGGVLSHGAIVARDFGIPAVVLPEATRLLPAGALVDVDGDRARVALADGAEP